MKKYYITLAILVVLFLTLLAVFVLQSTSQIGEFCLDEYSFFLGNPSSDYAFGEINSSKDARDAAEEVWITTYGKDLANCKPYSVFYDETNTVWLIHGNNDLLAYYFGIYTRLGGDPYVIINQEDGQVLSVWHTK